MQDIETNEETEAWVGGALPQSYRDFLDKHAESLSVGDSVLLYGREDIQERNKTYETKTYSPGYLTIGDDGGGRQILLSLSDARLSLVDAGSMDPTLAELVADNFGEWLAAGCPLPHEGDET